MVASVILEDEIVLMPSRALSFKGAIGDSEGEGCVCVQIVEPKTYGSRHQRAKQKRIALHFLSNIKTTGGERKESDTSWNLQADSHSCEDQILLPSPELILAEGNKEVDQISIRLRGRKYKFINQPHFKEEWYKTLWERKITNIGLLTAKSFMSFRKSYPTLCYSITPYRRVLQTDKTSGIINSFQTVKQTKKHCKFNSLWKENSYGYLLFAAWGNDSDSLRKINALIQNPSSVKNIFNKKMILWLRNWSLKWKKERILQRKIDRKYHAYYVDDPRLSQGTHKTVITSINPMYTFSVLRYANHETLKNELNDEYRKLHPWIPFSLTLSKIRNLKREALEYWFKHGLEISTLALAIVYFEKLIVKQIVFKENRKLKFAVCLLLAFKFNEAYNHSYRENCCDGDYSNSLINMSSSEDDDDKIAINSLKTKREKRKVRSCGSTVYNYVQQLFGISQKELVKNEMVVLVELSFGLFVKHRDIIIHFTRLLGVLALRPREYLGEKNYALHCMGDSTDRRSTEDRKVANSV